MGRLVIVSNRVSMPSDETRRADGLEVVLRPALEHKGRRVWFGWSGKVARADQLATRAVRHKNVEYIVTDLSKDDFEECCSGFANWVLWPILHYRPDLAEFASGNLSGYFRVNDRFATELTRRREIPPGIRNKPVRSVTERPSIGSRTMHGRNL